MTRSPDGHRARIGKKPALFRRQVVRERPQLFETRAWEQLGLFILCADRTEVDEHTAHPAKPAEQHELGFVSRADERMIPSDEGDARFRL